jgi:hypothetical protein
MIIIRRKCKIAFIRSGILIKGLKQMYALRRTGASGNGNSENVCPIISNFFPN